MNRGLRHAVLLLGVLLLGACSAGTRFAYDHLRTLSRWELGSYVELTAAQKTAFDREFDALQAWHRSTQLPLYAVDLRGTAALFETGNPDAAALDDLRKRVEAHGEALFDTARPRVARLLALLDDDQVTAALAHQRQEDEKVLRKLETRKPDARRKAELKNRIDGIEEWLGPLTPEQKARLGSQLDEDIDRGVLDPERRRAASAKGLDRVGGLLERRREADFEQRLEAITEPADAEQSARETEARTRNRRRFVDFMQTVTADQRRHLRARLLEFADDCDALAAETRP